MIDGVEEPTLPGHPVAVASSLPSIAPPEGWFFRDLFTRSGGHAKC